MADNKNKWIDNIISLDFEDSKLPVFSEKPNKEWVYFGEEDNYPEYLLLLSNKSAKHNAIINGKVNYIYGNGLQSSSNNEEFNKWIKRCNNANEGMAEVAIKMVKDIETFGGFYLFIVPNMFGEIVEIHHVDFNKMRTNHSRDKFFFKENWSNRKEEMTEYPIYVKDSKVVSVFSFREYRQGNGVYPLPNYISAINYIEADYEVSKCALSNAKTGFSASKFINFYNGEPDSEDKKKEIQRRFEKNLTGSGGKKVLIGFNHDPAKKPTIEDLGSSDLTKENFTNIDDLICANIYAGHQITSPMLFGIMESGKLGAGNELKFAFDIFKNTYVNFKQKQIEEVVNFLAERVFGVEGDIKLQDVDPVGLPLSDQILLQYAPVEFLWEKMGIPLDKYKDQLPAIKAAQGNSNSKGNSQSSSNGGSSMGGGDSQEMVNDNIKNLSAKQHQQLTRIIRQHSKGQLSTPQAKTLLKASLGLKDDEINSLLGIDQEEKKFESEVENFYTEQEVADMFEEIGEAKENFIIIKSKKAKFIDEEFTIEECFDAVETAETEEARNEINVLDNAKKAAKKAGEKRKFPKISVKYSYDPLPGLEPIIKNTRPFCRKLIQLHRLYTRSEIQMLSDRVGYSVFDRRGGFWNMGGEISPSCRHIWKSHVVIKRDI